MLEIFNAGGLLMWPILICAIVAMGIILERFWTLQRRSILPPGLLSSVWKAHGRSALDAKKIDEIRKGSPLGRVLSVGLINRHHDRDVMKEAIEEVGRQVAHELDRFLNTLGTIAAVTPLLGLLGTVIGMIRVFSTIVEHGVGNPGQLAGGISEALITTAAGITVAIPALIFYRYLRGRVDTLVLGMEEEALKMVEVMQGEREDIQDSER